MKIGIVGAGHMAKDLFSLFLNAGNNVTLYFRNKDAQAKIEEDLLSNLKKRIAKGGPRASTASEVLSRICLTHNLHDLSSSDLIIENISEDINQKHILFKELDRICDKSVILTSNSSFIPPDYFSENLLYPERVMGWHFFYPSKLISFVELIPSNKTNQSTLEAIKNISQDLGLHPIVCKNVPGFLINRIIPSFYNEGLLLWEEGYYSAEEIDNIAKENISRVGPLESCDHIGIDLVEHGNLQFKEIFRSGVLNPPILSNLIKNNRLGIKTDHGIYKYNDGKKTNELAEFIKSARYHEVKHYEIEYIKSRLKSIIIIEALEQEKFGLGSANDIDRALVELLGLNFKPIESFKSKDMNESINQFTDLKTKFGKRFDISI